MTARWIAGRGRIRLWDMLAVIRGAAADMLLSLAILVGWTLLTLGIASVAGGRARTVYLISAGVFLLSLAGWKLLYRLAADGLYVLTRKKPRA